jgi:hypothetical protein
MYAGTFTKIPLVLTDLHPTDYGWVFTFNSEKAERTNDWQDEIFGLGPILVLAHDGTVVELGTAHVLEKELRAYEKANGLGSGPQS